MLEALETGRAYSSVSLSSGGGDDGDGARPAGVDRHRGAPSTRSPRTAPCSRPGFSALDERERRILHLRFFEGLTQSQIAQQVGISQMHVSRLIRRALEKIRDEIAEDELAELLQHRAGRASAEAVSRPLGCGPWGIRPPPAVELPPTRSCPDDLALVR